MTAFTWYALIDAEFYFGLWLLLVVLPAAGIAWVVAWARGRAK